MSEAHPGLGWGVVGIGSFTRSTIAPAMSAISECEPVAAMSRDRGRAEAFAAEFGFQGAYTDYGAMVADPGVDAVYIATPNALHPAQVEEAAAAGKHVLCEKPLANDVASARRAVEACRHAGVHLGINFHNRYLPWVADVARMLARGTIGEVEVVELDVGSGPRHYENWRADPALAGLGSVHNVGVHAFDFLRVLLDSEPARVMTMFDLAPPSESVEMLAMVLLRFQNGAFVYCNCNERLAHPRNTIAIHGTGGRITGTGLTRSRSDGYLSVLTEEGETVTHYPAPDAHRLCLEAFTRSVLEDRPPSPSGLDGLRSVQLCEAIARSATRGERVEVDYSLTADRHGGGHDSGDT